MRTLIISDVHANLAALEAVLSAATPFDSAWCLGDLVDYGPDPNECVERIRNLPRLTCITGNHEAAVLEMLAIESFNGDARKSALWTAKQLTDENRQFLLGLPETAAVSQVSLAHGSPRFPVWEYVLDTQTAAENFHHFETPICFVGHSHIPLIFYKNGFEHGTEYLILKDQNVLHLEGKSIINPGSVGQPRDGDPRASFAIFDTDTNTWQQYRVEYDIKSVQKRIRDAGLPHNHANRLSSGS